MFPYTTDGYKEAMKYLEDSRQAHLIEKELSKDGWTIVALANSLKKASL